MRKVLPPLALAAGMIFLGAATTAQTLPTDFSCSQAAEDAKFIQADPSLLEAREEYEAEIQAYIEEHRYEKASQSTYIIPVVFHVLHQNGSENISEAQIKDAVRILSEDYRKMNADFSKVGSSFSPIAADCNIEFRLATRDPNGDHTNGIVRYVTPHTTQGLEQSKAGKYWGRDKYMHVWTVKSIQSGSVGYAHMPYIVDQYDESDGIMIRSDHVGSIGNSSYTNSHSLTHEVGHWLDLYHTFGIDGNPGQSANCNKTDMVDDTPTTVGSYSCDVSRSTCGSLDNVQNFMDYSYCFRMFTEGQKQRMHAALNSSKSQRNLIWRTQNLIATGTLTDVREYIEKNLEMTIAPNPANELTNLSFNLIEEERVSIKVVDMLGKTVNTVIDGQFTAGKYRFPLNEANDLTSGIYFVQLNIGNNIFSKKLIVQ